MRKIIVRMPNWIGDLVMALPVIEDLREAYPESHIAILCGGPLGQVLEGNPHIDEIISYSRKRRYFPKDSEGASLVKRLKQGEYDLGLVLPNSFSSAWLFWISGVKKRIGYYKWHRAILLNRGKRFPKNKAKIHLVRVYKMLLKKVLVEESHTKPKIYIEPATKKIGQTKIGFNPGAAYGSAKCWLPERFAEVAKNLVRDIPNVQVVLYGDATSMSVTEKICGLLPKEMIESGQVVDLANKTSLREFLAELGSLDAILSNDSGPMHLAAAMEIPLVALFGSTNDIATGPYEWGTVIHKRVECSPCYKRVCPIDFRCMKRIESDEVTEEVKKALIVRSRASLANPVSLEGAKSPVVYSGKNRNLDRLRVGTIILGAGMGRRLRQNGPKGCIEIGGKSLYETIIGKSSKRCAVLTSPATHLETEKHFEEKGISGVDLFMSRCLPREGREFEESPEGNGAVFDAFIASGLYDEWDDVDLISVVPIDNILANPMHREMIESCEELSVLGIEREDPSESLGILIDRNGKLEVAEYFEAGEQAGAEWNLGFTGCFMCTKEFFMKAAQMTWPWHEVERSGVRHFERFAFDAFRCARSYQVVVGDREKLFAPIKTKGDIANIEERMSAYSMSAEVGVTETGVKEEI